jgi:hypothetical protein
MSGDDDFCCSGFDPKKWDKKKVTWKGKLFVKDKVWSFFHIPLNFGSVLKKNMKKIEDNNAKLKNCMILSDEVSPFYSNIYISVKRVVPSVHDVKLSGTFLTKVYEGPYKNMKTWIKDMEEYVRLEKMELKHMYFYYATCPNCAKKLGKNYVVLFAEI